MLKMASVFLGIYSGTMGLTKVAKNFSQLVYFLKLCPLSYRSLTKWAPKPGWVTSEAVGRDGVSMGSVQGGVFY